MSYESVDYPVIKIDNDFKDRVANFIERTDSLYGERYLNCLTVDQAVREIDKLYRKKLLAEPISVYVQKEIEWRLEEK
jgi:hypothetical protein